MRRGASGVSALIAIDKPEGPTSHDVVAAVRRATGEGRVGHAGTLDPAASGVLVVGVGQGTRLMGELSLDTKSYLARVSFGSETDTDDAEGETAREADAPARVLDEAWASEVAASLVGEHEQVPPAYSAVSRGGTRAYAAARAGAPLELEARRVSVLDCRLVAVVDGEAPAWVFALTVSKGFYVRALARDLGRSLGSAAHLSALRRTQAGRVGLADCMALDELAEGGLDVVVARALDPVAALGAPRRDLTAAEAADVACGRPLALGDASALAEGERCALVADGRLMGVWRRSGARLVCSSNFPNGILGVRP